MSLMAFTPLSRELGKMSSGEVPQETDDDDVIGAVLVDVGLALITSCS